MLTPPHMDTKVVLNSQAEGVSRLLVSLALKHPGIFRGMSLHNPGGIQAQSRHNLSLTEELENLRVANVGEGRGKIRTDIKINLLL